MTANVKVTHHPRTLCSAGDMEIWTPVEPKNYQKSCSWRHCSAKNKNYV